ncbi:MAG: rod shape-determining protein MreD [Gemmatimonadales bacterium]
MTEARAQRTRLLGVMLLLAALQFYLRPRIANPRLAPDFLLIALLVYGIRSRPGAAAVAGFAIGIVTDALTPARFGAGALAGTLVGYLASWGRAVFFADNLRVNAGLFAGGLWLRNLIILLASDEGSGGFWQQLAIWSPLEALTTAITGVLVLMVFRRWLDLRLES